ncbi:UDP-N-acetylglucosamine--N-acetylmuramyl-(pentapeptide) pyrophosphoryl-undecaprenol N-acetylglucosamine transferase [Actinomyces succiniciruminis]|uniref:UDP-N-acetylglucosamine--N-acetylmuramyl-(pentapeptide) pyrophosphoryl-undecaprenol N-acetylglucosamine transferase n=1 Tax=Actinomyces succiniciruminis TaxID=1522002 RepID=A0A1L7RNJ0_9ACTO|nr:UDP-N-acetylglucosamine--N-acetylmuramyl-(pentapeptide) pyrophosphoryl-undecaprenol N-acetylglucosamine transferase [Actinomyces succiniciruminis]CED91038.1 UDP-N-acetylglucosamine--N-acetylmuramyl-(pentapeptide) pyrophosphoryl-undecaprenol N-acetylglucosamine transferase PE=3 SV [Actinomyces succiniciruminis]
MSDTPTPEPAADGPTGRPLRVLLAGGGTAGHVNPLLATAAALRDDTSGGDPDTDILVLGTKEGLEERLVPEAGYPLAHVPRVPMPRRPTGDLLLLPRRLHRAVDAAGQAIAQVGADVVVGFGGFVSTPAYLAARSAGVPVVIHEQNARPGLANRLGARWAAAVALTFASTPLAATHGRTEVTGLPLRPAIGALAARLNDDADAARREGAAALGLDPAAPTLLVTGGSLGAQHLNEVLCDCAARLPENLQVLHLTGRGKDAPVRAALERAAAGAPGLLERYHVLDYLTTMEQAYACADGVICRSGAGTVAELTALGLPALYVPLPIGNGEQRLNAADCVAAGGGTLVGDADLSGDDVLAFTGLLTDPTRRAQAAAAAASTGVRDGAARLAALIRAAAGRVPGTAQADENQEPGQ